MNKKFLIAALVAAMSITMTACSKDNIDTETTETTAETTVETMPGETMPGETTATNITETSVPYMTEPIETTTAMKNINSNILPGHQNNNIDNNINNDEIVGTGLIESAKKDDGFITYTRNSLEEDIQATGMVIKPVDLMTIMNDYDTYGNNTRIVYKFAMMNTESVQMYKTNAQSIYLTSLKLNNENYLVSFGTNENVSNISEVLPYCRKGKYIEYYAYATISKDANVILMPFIAGTEKGGYYIIQPTFKSFGSELPADMRIPVEIGDDQIPSATETTTTQSTNSVDKIILNISSIKNDDILTTIECTLQNTYPLPVTLSAYSLKINNTDYSSKFTANIDIPKDSITSGKLFVSGTEIKLNDELEIVFSVQNTETKENYGRITFPIKIAN